MNRTSWQRHKIDVDPKPYIYGNIIYQPAKARKQLDGVTIFYIGTLAFLAIAYAIFR